MLVARKLPGTEDDAAGADDIIRLDESQVVLPVHGLMTR